MIKEYIPHPIDTSSIQLDEDLLALTEVLSKNTHEVWSKGRLADGWKYGPTRNDEKKEHPCLIPYEELPENEKDYDRNTAMETIKTLLALGYSIRKL